MSTFGEHVDLTSNLSSILRRYPFGIGVFREIIQNAEDAGATKQIFLLDRRTHRSDSLVHKDLAHLQCPAFLAYNDAVFSDTDWSAIQTVSQSSKSSDAEKIGKHGLGSRAYYHFTDNPQYLSGDHVAIFDPHQSVFPGGGWRMSIAEANSDYPDQLEPFRSLLGDNNTAFRGTIVRLPLRRASSNSKISSETPSPEAIRDLLDKFIDEELHVVMLFLSHLKTIEVKEIDDHGMESVLAIADSSTKRYELNPGGDPSSFTLDCRTIEVTDTSVRPGTHQYHWLLVRSSFLPEDVIKRLSDRSRDSHDSIASNLKKEKLRPHVALAFPSSFSQTFYGRLFTYLPLPLRTNSPCHIHAVFALTDARQNLRNPSETVLPGTPDAFAVAWNDFVFRDLIPRTWLGFLEKFSSCRLPASVGIPSIYHVLPPLQDHHTTGDATYWNSLLRDLITFALNRKAQIWPVFPSPDVVPQVPSYTSIEGSYIASEPVDRNTLHVLSKAGLTIVVPPPDLFSLLLQQCPLRELAPGGVRRELINHDQHHFASMEQNERNTIIEFLLRSRELNQLIDVPIVSLSSGGLVALRAKADDSQTTHVLMTEADQELFCRFEPTSIALGVLPPVARTLLLEQGNTLLNVETLTCAHVTKYIVAACQHYALDTSESTRDKSEWTEACAWLNQLWTWMVPCPFADDLLSVIETLPLMPTTSDKLRTVKHRVFLHASQLVPSQREALSLVGIDFLHPSIHADFFQLQHPERVRSVSSVTDLLDALDPAPLGPLDGNIVRCLREQLASTLTPMVHLSDSQKMVLRALPIHPVLTPTSDGNLALADVTNLSPKHDIYCIGSLESMSLPLPLVPDVHFVDCTPPDERPLLDHILGVVEPLKEDRILQLYRRHIVEQAPASRLRVLQFLEKHPTYRKPAMMNALQSSSIVLVGGGGSAPHWCAPRDVVDPKSSIASLISLDDMNSVVEDDSVNSQTVRALGSLHLLRRALDDEFVSERIRHISSLPVDYALDAARRLLSTLDSTWYNCSGVRYDPEFAWIPTALGLRRPQDCRDTSERVICDRVMPLLDMQPLQSMSLRRLLGWHEPVPMDRVIEQFRLVLGEDHENVDAHQSLADLICEFGRRLSSLTSTQLDAISAFAHCKQWVPTHEGGLLRPSFAVFRLNNRVRGFGCVSYTLADRPGVKGFLQHMGCTTRPSNSAIVEQLIALKVCEPSEDIALQSVELLHALQLSSLSEGERTSLVAPGTDGHLYHVCKLFYNDIGSRANFLKVPDDRVRIHGSMSAALCRDVGVPSLGSLNLEVLDFASEEMREDLTTRIRNVLKSYDVQQAFNEFLANAVDAGAKKFNVMLDEEINRQARFPDVLCEGIAEFCAGPALVVQNDAEFTENDIRGICRIGRGGKEGRESTIGRFGLGSLTFYHFSEIAMILTGSYLLLLDPSGLHLPDRNTHVVLLENIRRVYPGHLQVFDGLFGFRASDDRYNGTIIRLPLRKPEHAIRPGSLSKSPCSTGDIHMMLRKYRSVASRSLFFVDVDEITARESRHVRPLWSVSARREEEQSDDPIYQRQRLCISSIDGSGLGEQQTSWRIFKARISPSSLPPEKPWLPSIIAKHQLKQLSVALAAELPSNGRELERSPTRYLYSSLPLPIKTSLPTHVHASFVLADDRRNIRWDGDGTLNEDSRFNHWLLSAVLPPLFLALIESWATDFADSYSSWPGVNGDVTDTMSQAVSNGLYTDECLGSSPRKVFRSVTGRRLCPSSIALMSDGASPVKTVLLELRPDDLVELEHVPHVRFLVVTRTSIKCVDPGYVCDVISCMRSRFVDAFRTETITIPVVEGIIRYISPWGAYSKKLVGLPLLPLADDTLADLQDCGGGSTTVLAGTWKELKPWTLFPPRHFLHPSFPQTLLLDNGYNVSSFRGSTVIALLQDKLPRAESWCEVSAEDREWVSHFWNLFTQYEIPLDDLKPFPLLPTTDDEVFVSLNNACSLPSFALPSNISATNSSRIDLVRKLGGVAVRRTLAGRQKLPSAVRAALDTVAFDFSRVLQIFCHFHSRQNSIQAKIERTLSVLEQKTLATWLRSSLKTSCIKDMALTDVLRHLPIWPASRGNSPSTLRPLADAAVRILPSVVGSADRIALFLDPRLYFVEYSPEIKKLKNATVMSNSEFITCLSFPPRLRSDDVFSRYEVLLTNLFRLSMNNLAHDLKVPNEDQDMVSARSLYKYSVPEFQAAFSKRPDNFLHRRLRLASYEDRLVPYGLRKDMSLENFEACVRAIDEDFDKESSEDRDTAMAVYNFYTTRLPAMGSSDAWWRELDSYAFIPRHRLRRLGGTDLDTKFERFAAHLPLLVHPTKILRREYASVAWTQRALFAEASGLFAEAPGKRLFMVDETLGVPTVDEAVKHLRVLVREVARAHPRDRELLADIKATYEFLDQRHDQAQTYLRRHRREELFLNVDDPTQDDWTFCRAEQIMFNVPDEDGRFEVRRFLSPFRALLLAGGAEEIRLPEAPRVPQTPVEEQLSRLRASFQELRTARLLTDVVFAVSGSAEDGADNVWAHRALLSTASDHFRDLFCGGFTESGPASSQNPVVVHMEDALDVKCARLVVDHIYTGSFDENQDRDCLIALLHLAHLWRLDGVQASAEALLVNTISPGTYVDLRNHARIVQATTLLGQIDEFESQNAVALSNMSQFGSEDM